MPTGGPFPEGRGDLAGWSCKTRVVATFRPFATERTWLVMPPPAESDAVLRYFERNRAHLEPWEPARPDTFYTQRFWRDRLIANRRELEQGAAMRLFAVSRGLPPQHPDRVIASCNFSNVVGGAFQACTLGYGLDHAQVGRGLMEEILRAAIPVAFETFRLHRIQANYQPVNERSGRLLRRLGFTVEGYARDYLQIAGEWRDHVLTSITRPD